MDQERFDAWTRHVTTKPNRRRVFAAIGALSLGVVADSASAKNRKCKKCGGRCVPKTAVCCPAQEGGGYCNSGNTCCPPSPDFPKGSCAVGGQGKCCTVAEGGGFCPLTRPVCCPPTLQGSRFCAPSGYKCCTSVEGGGACPVGTNCCPIPGEVVCPPTNYTCCPGRGVCDPEFPVCCPPSPSFPEGICAKRGVPCPRVGDVTIESANYRSLQQSKGRAWHQQANGAQKGDKAAGSSRKGVD